MSSNFFFIGNPTYSRSAASIVCDQLADFIMLACGRISLTSNLLLHLTCCLERFHVLPKRHVASVATTSRWLRRELKHLALFCRHFNDDIVQEGRVTVHG